MFDLSLNKFNHSYKESRTKERKKERDKASKLESKKAGKRATQQASKKERVIVFYHGQITDDKMHETNNNQESPSVMGDYPNPKGLIILPTCIWRSEG